MKSAARFAAFLAACAAHAEVDYIKDVKPLLQERCYACHGALKQKGSLRLDTAASIFKGGESGPAIDRNSSEKSLLLQRVTSADTDERMPPEHEGELFKEAQVAVLRAWIASGAKAPADEKPESDPRDHWAFRPRTRPAVPTVRNATWVRNPIDAFIAAQHEKHGLTPEKDAPREVLMRRLWIDLTGVPPSAEEASAFLAADTYEATVDKLLADPRHGERWARHWMDVWRYSDWWGLNEQLRNSQKHMWHFRDWIVESLNANVPYDEMLRQMLAADELYPADPQKLRATGFLARNFFLFNRNPWMEETVEHVSKGLLGLTMNCTKCHDHKYDPISQTDFYRMRAFFEPLHVRLDAVPGELDFEKNGIPRVFDGLLDEPTFRYIRGEESKPDKSAPVAPGVPALLAQGDLAARSVTLPAEASQPERRAWVLEAHIADARKKLADARDKAAQAKKTATPPPAVEAKPTTGTGVSFVENFASLDQKRWKLFGSEWEMKPGNLSQKRDGQQSAVLRLLEPAPRDFDATLRFTIHGGSTYRSVGISFDSTRPDPTKPGDTKDTEVFIYASGHPPGPKLQAAFRSDGQDHYPADGLRAEKVALNREHTLRVRVRDNLVNASLNGGDVLAWRSPLPRCDGSLQFTTFDAVASFHEITIAPLPPDSRLTDASAKTKPVTVNAESAVELADARLDSVIKRADAMRAVWNSSPDAKDKRDAAIRAEQKVAVLELRQKASDADKATKAERVLAEPLKPDATFTALTGAQWTPTRFKDSTKDDPRITFPPISTGRRTALAAWIADARNPLTARVAVNHIWARHMGQPLVATMFDFGRKGALPTHPELLDWLASELVESGWDMRRIHRLIVTSAAYRMSSSLAGAEASSGKDPDNRHLWRRLPQRIESEVVRDSLLALSGELDPALGGPSVAPSAQENSRRRSLYFFHSNIEKNRFLATFDAADVKDCYRRDQSIVPQQALAMSNSALVHTAAEKIAARITKSAPEEPAFIRAAWLQLLAIAPGETELAATTRSLAAWRALPGANDTTARAQFIRVLLNHNDFVTLR